MADTWRERVIRARSQAGFSREDQERAARWSTCAVGEQARRRSGTVQFANGRPVDRELDVLGTTFFAAILAGDVARAETTLDAIVERVRELKRLVTREGV